jgi:hypothetical protein
VEPIIVHRKRTKVLTVSLARDISDESFESQIREGKDSESELIATWDIAFLTDGTDGELVFTLDDAVTTNVEKARGWMDIKQITGSEPISVFDEPLEVLFKNPITE